MKIGVFDSGLGGLTVLKSMLEILPSCEYVYLGDTARLPYGSKSAATIENYTEQNLKFLKSQNVDAMVIACNSASAYYYKTHFENVPVFTVIGPTSEAALLNTENKKIGLLATRATVNSQSYQKKIAELDANAQVFAIAAPLLVPFAEEGLIDDPLTNLISYRYMQPILSENVECLILGCTHYPLLIHALQKVAGDLPLIESGPALSYHIIRELGLQKETGKKTSQLDIFTTDQMGHFKSWAEKILQPYQPKSWTQINL